MRAAPAILMYHAVGTGADPHYTVAAGEFRAQLDWVARQGGARSSVADVLAGARAPTVLITFDDGHISNYERAFPMLLERGLRAEFFVNTAHVGQPGFIDWGQLREMAEAGMSIQSHGHTHRYFTALTPAELREELARSRALIGEKLGTPATLLAPPGGRMDAHLFALAAELGYVRVLASQPGLWRRPDADVLPRLAVTAAHRGEAFIRLAAPGRGRLALARLRYGALAAAKLALGDGRYERVRASLLGQDGGE